MRVARRRSDGGWDFSDPALSIKPPGLYPVDTISSACSSPTTSISTMAAYKKSDRPPGNITRGYTEIDENWLAPPAYTPSVLS